VVVGDGKVGKSSLIRRLVHDEFQDNFYHSADETFTKTTTYFGNQVLVHITDSASDYDFSNAVSNKVNAIAVIYDVSNRNTFEHACTLLTNAQTAASNVKLVLIANKVDLAHDGKRAVEYSEAEAKARNIRATFVEASAKSNTNVPRVLEQLIKTSWVI